MMYDQPRVVDFPEARNPTQPEIGLQSIVHGSAYVVETVGKCHIIAHSHAEVVYFIADRTLERREDFFTHGSERICAYVALA